MRDTHARETGRTLKTCERHLSSSTWNTETQHLNLMHNLALLKQITIKYSIKAYKPNTLIASCIDNIYLNTINSHSLNVQFHTCMSRCIILQIPNLKHYIVIVTSIQENTRNKNNITCFSKPFKFAPEDHPRKTGPKFHKAAVIQW